MALSVVAVSTSSRKTKPAISVTLLLENGNERIVSISQSQLKKLDTEEEIVAAAIAFADAAGVELPPFFAHINDDGTVAVALFAEPEVWPEDVEP